MKKGSIKLLVAIGIILILLIIAAVLFIYVVREDQQVVLLRFGKVIGTVNVEGQPIIYDENNNPVEIKNTKGAGLRFKAPWTNALFFSKRIKRWDGEANEIPTLPDSQNIFVDATARWKIVDPAKLYKRLNGDEEETSKRLDNAIDSAVRDIISSSFFIQVVASDSDEIEEFFRNDSKLAPYLDDVMKNGKIAGRDEIQKQILNTLKVKNEAGEQDEGNLSSYGLEVSQIIIKRVGYTDSNRQEAYKRMIAERTKVAREKIAVGNRKKKEIEGKIDRYKREKLSLAYRLSEIIKGQGDAKAAKIYANAYKNDPQDLARGYASKEDFYRFYKTLDAYANLPQDTELTLSTDSSFFTLLKDMNAVIGAETGSYQYDEDWLNKEELEEDKWNDDEIEKEIANSLEMMDDADLEGIVDEGVSEEEIEGETNFDYIESPDDEIEEDTTETQPENETDVTTEEENTTDTETETDNE